MKECEQVEGVTRDIDIYFEFVYKCLSQVNQISLSTATYVWNRKILATAFGNSHKLFLMFVGKRAMMRSLPVAGSVASAAVVVVGRDAQVPS